MFFSQLIRPRRKVAFPFFCVAPFICLAFLSFTFLLSSRPSTQSSLRSSFDRASGTNRARLPGDKVQISDWQQPSQSMMASQLMEVDQLKALTSYVSNVELELAKHHHLKDAIELAVSLTPAALPFFQTLAHIHRR